MKNKGFTLIELLVVIAIIGILSTIVLVSVNSARDKANDVAIKVAIDQTRSVAELIYDDVSPNSYVGIPPDSGLCDGNGGLNTANLTYKTQLSNIVTSVSNNGGGTPVCYASASAYCVQGKLKTGTTDYWCVDSGGIAGSTANCASSNIKCTTP